MSSNTNPYSIVNRYERKIKDQGVIGLDYETPEEVFQRELKLVIMQRYSD